MHIIVASSNLFRRELSSYILSEAGYAVCEVSDSDGLLRQIERLQPVLVILDHWLNGLGGLELTRAIRQRSLVPILTLTSQSSLAENGHPAAYGDSSLSWPYQADDLLSKVRAMVGRTPYAPAASTSRVYGEQLQQVDGTV